MMPATNSRCEANTKKHGTQCANGEAAWCEAQKKMLCHLHHPDGTYRQQVAAKRLTHRRSLPSVLPPDRVRSPNSLSIHVLSRKERDAELMPDGGKTPEMDRPCTISMTAGKAEPERPPKTLFRPR